MDFTVLGPVRAVQDGAALPIGGAKPRALLGALLNERGRMVPAERLCAAIWGSRPPSSARGLLHTYVSGLRRAFADAGRDGSLRRDGGGYLLDIAEDRVDAEVFERLLDTARRQVADGRRAAAVAAYRAAEALWSGPAFGGIAGGYLSAQASRLDELRITALSERITTELHDGAHAALVAELTSLVREHPLREQLWASLMLALCRLERRGEALHTFREADRLLRTELGIEPGEALRELHQAILADEQWLTAPEQATVTGNQLPAARPLVGRAAEARRAAALLRERAIVVLTGAPGIGKSALAVRVAADVRAEFGDGVLYADLRGYRPGGAGDTGDVLGGFLRALGVPEPPEPADERAALFRSRTENRRLLLVLDDVRHPEQVRPLLPNTAGCAVLLTSRNGLAGLAASHGAHRLHLDVLARDAAAELVLAGGTGAADRGAADAVAEVARVCGGNPLAITAATAKIPAARALAGYLGALGDGDLLAALAIGGDLRSGVGERIAASYALLDPASRQVFLAVGALGDRPVDASALAARLGARTPDVLLRLENLVAENLAHRLPGGYAMHPLIGAYARSVSTVDSFPPAGEPYAPARTGETLRPEPHAPAPGHQPVTRPRTRRRLRRHTP